MPKFLFAFLSAFFFLLNLATVSAQETEQKDAKTIELEKKITELEMQVKAKDAKIAGLEAKVIAQDQLLKDHAVLLVRTVLILRTGLAISHLDHRMTMLGHEKGEEAEVSEVQKWIDKLNPIGTNARGLSTVAEVDVAIKAFSDPFPDFGTVVGEEEMEAWRQNQVKYLEILKERLTPPPAPTSQPSEKKGGGDKKPEDNKK